MATYAPDGLPGVEPGISKKVARSVTLPVVADTGTVSDRDPLEQIFDRFVTPAEVGKGTSTGLGGGHDEEPVWQPPLVEILERLLQSRDEHLRQV
jgi:hypothetical protein